jgi:hypothetical protein
MSTLIASLTIGEMITSTTPHSLEADWNLVVHQGRLAGVGTDNPTRWRKVEKQNWLDAALAAIRAAAARELLTRRQRAWYDRRVVEPTK